MNADAQRVRSLFLAAVEGHTPEQWEAFLEEACAGDDALRRRVAVLLSAHGQPNSLLDSPATLGVTTEATSQEQQGAEIGPYKVMELVGEGGMGLVYVAEQTQPVRRKVALKLIKPGMDSKQVVARFEAERQALALMDHPHIARVFDGGSTPSGRPFFVMELVHGVSITQFCDEHRLTTRERLGLFVQVCQAVQHAHQKGIIHRDVKPSNILVTSHDGTPVAKVIDFGVAKAIGQQLTDKTIHTQLTQMVGTPLYMSPEQAGQGGQDIDTRTDVYALGVLLYELLTGTTPFDKERLGQVDHDELRRIIREEEPVLPSTRISALGPAAHAVSLNRQSGPRQLSQVLRGELDWIVMKALEKDRNRRYESASAFAADVQRFLADEPVDACAPTAYYRFRKFARRNRAAFVTASAVALVVLLAIVGLATSTAVIANALQAEIQAKDEWKGALAREREAAYRYQIALAERFWLADQVKEARRVLGECDPELRHWEWNYLKRLFDGGLLSLQGHTRSVVGVAFSFDGQRIASISRDSDAALEGLNGQEGVRSELQVWDTVSGQQLLSRTLAPVDAVGFRSDGTLLALAFQANDVVVYDAAAGRELFRLQGHTGQVRCVAFSPDGKGLASAGADETVKVWDLADGREMHTFRGHRRSVACLSFSGDGRLLASTSRGASPPVIHGEVKVWDLRAGKEKLGLDGYPSHFTGVAISPDGLELATTSGDGMVRIWDVETGKESRSFSGNGRRVQVLAWSPAARRISFMEIDDTGREVLRVRDEMRWIAMAMEDGIIRILDTATGREVFTFRGHTAAVRSLAFSRDGTKLATAGWDETVKLWHATMGTEARALKEEANRSREHRPVQERYVGPKWLAFGPDAAELAAVCGIGTVRLYDARTGRASGTWNEEAYHLGDVAFSHDGRLVAAAIVPGQWLGQEVIEREEPLVKVWARSSGKEVLTLRTRAHRVAFSPDATLLATSDQGTIVVWDAGTGQKVLRLKTLAEGACCIAFSPDGRHLAAAGSTPGFLREGERGTTRHDLEVWDVSKGQRVLHRPCKDRVARLAFHPDGKHLAGVGEGPGVVWNTATGAPACFLSGHTDEVTDVVFTPDGRRVFTASSDRMVKVWDADSGKELLTLRGHSQAVVGLALSPDGHSLASAGEDGIVRIWDAPRSQ